METKPAEQKTIWRIRQAQLQLLIVDSLLSSRAITFSTARARMDIAQYSTRTASRARSIIASFEMINYSRFGKFTHTQNRTETRENKIIKIQKCSQNNPLVLMALTWVSSCVSALSSPSSDDTDKYYKVCAGCCRCEWCRQGWRWILCPPTSRPRSKDSGSYKVPYKNKRKLTNIYTQHYDYHMKYRRENIIRPYVR